MNKAAIEFNALFGYFAKDDVFFDAFDCGFVVVDTVASAGMQQAVRASGSAGGNFAAFDDGDIKAT